MEKGIGVITFYTLSHKRYDFLEMQLKSFKKHISEPFKFIVVNNANFDKDRNKIGSNYWQINNWCKNNNIEVIDTIRDEELIAKIKTYDGENVLNNEGIYTNSVIACAYPMCFLWKYYISKRNDKICIIDSDMFFIAKEDTESLLNKYDMVYMPQSRGETSENIKIEYFWNGLFYANLAKMPEKELLDWWCGHIYGNPVDVGGRGFFYLQKYKSQLKILELKLHYIKEDPNCGFENANYEFFEAENGRTLLHHRGGSNWCLSEPDYLKKKTAWIKKTYDL